MLNWLRSGTSWFQRFSLVLLASLSLGSSALASGEAAAVLGRIGDSSVSSVTKYGGAVTLVIVGFVALMILGFLANFLIGLINPKQD